MKKLSQCFLVLCCTLTAILFAVQTVHADSSFLTPEENLWLKSRNNTIVVYPTKNFPPFSYQNSSGTPQGLSIDYIELIAEKVGAKIQYLQGRSMSQILDDVKAGKGDVVTSITDTPDREELLYFTDNYVTVPNVIVVRKDYNGTRINSLNDLTGKKVAISSKHAVEEFVRKNNPRIVVDSMTDDEVSLQQVVLGEDDAAIMDIASLSFYLSKQVLSSVKIVGNVGFEYRPSFAVPKDKQILQSILDKGLQQISTQDRQILNDKWIIAPGEQENKNGVFVSIKNLFGPGTLYILFTIIVAIAVILAIHRKKYSHIYNRKKHNIGILKEEIAELENTSQELAEEIKNIRDIEEDIKDQMSKIEKS